MSESCDCSRPLWPATDFPTDEDEGEVSAANMAADDATNLLADTKTPPTDAPPALAEPAAEPAPVQVAGSAAAAPEPEQAASVSGQAFTLAALPPASGEDANKKDVEDERGGANAAANRGADSGSGAEASSPIGEGGAGRSYEARHTPKSNEGAKEPDCRMPSDTAPSFIGSGGGDPESPSLKAILEGARGTADLRHEEDDVDSPTLRAILAEAQRGADLEMDQLRTGTGAACSETPRSNASTPRDAPKTPRGGSRKPSRILGLFRKKI